MSIRSQAFPVPTPANPTAVFTQDEYVATGGGNKAAATTPGRLPLNEERQSLLRELAEARADNREKTAEDFRRSRNMDECKRAWKLEAAKRYRERQERDLAALGLPPSCAYLLESAQQQQQQHQHHPSRTARQEEGEDEDLDAKVYERSLKRLLKDDKPGALVRDLREREEKNAKRARPDHGEGGVSKQNAIFNKSLAKTMATDARAQTIKQSLERGTALQ